jgi:flagellar hook protein FlgE
MGTTSFFSALSGLSANRQAIDVIGNNLANLNTIGFKKSTTTFADVFSASLSSSVNGAGNPLEVGLGVRVGAIDQVFSQGSIKSTGSATDMAIQGGGFFMVQDAEGATTYTRAGKFSFDDGGNLVAPNGKILLGYPANAVGEIQLGQEPQAININAQVQSEPNVTTEIIMNTLLDADAEADSVLGEFSTPVRVYDSLGVPHTITYTFRRVEPAEVDSTGADAAVTWAFDINMDATEVADDDNGGVAVGAEGDRFSLLLGDIVNANPSVAGGDFPGRLHFDPDGKLVEVNMADAAIVNAAAAVDDGAGAGIWRADNNFVDPNGINIPPDGSAAFPNVSLISGANDITFSWDTFNPDGSTNLVSYASDTGSGTSSIDQDGFGVGALSSVVIDPDGIITGLFTNGDVRSLSQVALANFNNPQGLLASGENEFAQTPGSGQPSVGTPQSGGRGSVAGSVLELSNVDLAEEFTSLIINERGFQANSRVITTNDSLLQEAINLSR